MRVLVDDVESGLEALPIGEAVQTAASEARRRGRIVVEVEIDGRPFAGAALDAILGCDNPGAAEIVRLTTADLREQVGTVLDDAARELARADALQTSAAERIETSDSKGGMQQLGEALAIWGRVERAITLSTSLAEMPLESVTIDGIDAGQAVAELGDRLREIATALTARDAVGLSDTLLYDMPEITQRWRDLLAELRRRIVEDDG